MSDPLERLTEYANIGNRKCRYSNQSLLDAVLSVEDVQVYKPHPAVYQLAQDRLALYADEICFISSNGWDAYSAKAFGFYVVWCNRFGQVPERIPTTPDAEIKTLSELPELVGLR